jgi:hypothetical protein
VSAWSHSIVTTYFIDFSKQVIPLPAIPGAADDTTAANELLYEDVGDTLATDTSETAIETAGAVVPMNHPYEYVKPADNAENYQFTLCSAYGVPLEVGKNN